MPGKLVLADYFLGFATRAVSGGARPWRLYYESEAEAGLKEPRCRAAFSGDLYVSDGIKDIASTYYPLIGPYDLTDPDVAEFHVLLAKAAGIDGFMAEFTLGQEAYLLNLVAAARKYDFRIGVNWINQSHLAENVWPDRAAAMERAEQLVRWMAEHVYKPCGVRYHDRYLMLVFLAHPREPQKPFDPFFSPDEYRRLKEVAADARLHADYLTLPWEPLPDLPGGATSGPRVWDGYFPWIWLWPGSPVGEHECWTLATTREAYLQRLRDYYAMARRRQAEGRIGSFIGAVTPGFDDHRGQAWGEGQRRHLPRDNGQTYAGTWRELADSGADACLIITFNDWVESSQIEPSLELGYSELSETARQISQWRNSPLPSDTLLRLPELLFRARKDLGFLRSAGLAAEPGTRLSESLDLAARSLAARDTRAASDVLNSARAELKSLRGAAVARPVHVFWEYGFDSAGIELIPAAPLQRVTAGDFSGVALSGESPSAAFAVSEAARSTLRRGHFLGRLTFEYLDSGVDFLQVRVDAAETGRQIIASFKKTDTGRWLRASLDLVNARFSRSLPGPSDLQIFQRPGSSGGVRYVRVDGASYSL